MPFLSPSQQRQGTEGNRHWRQPLRNHGKIYTKLKQRSLYSATYVRRQCGTAHIHLPHAATNQSPARRAHSSKSAALSMAAVGTCWDKWTEGWRERWMDRQKDTMRTVPRATAIIIAWCHSTGSQRSHRYCSRGQEVSMGCCSSDGRMRGVPHCQCM